MGNTKNMKRHGETTQGKTAKLGEDRKHEDHGQELNRMPIGIGTCPEGLISGEQRVAGLNHSGSGVSSVVSGQSDVMLHMVIGWSGAPFWEVVHSKHQTTMNPQVARIRTHTL